MFIKRNEQQDSKQVTLICFHHTFSEKRHSSGLQARRSATINTTVGHPLQTQTPRLTLLILVSGPTGLCTVGATC